MNYHEDVRNSFGKRLSVSMTRKNISNIDLAKHIGVHPNTISQYRKDKQEPGLHKVTQIAQVLGEDIVWLVSGYTTDEMKQSNVISKKMLAVHERNPEFLSDSNAVLKKYFELKPEHQELVDTVILKLLRIENKI